MYDNPVLFRMRSILMAYRYLWRSTKNKYIDPENDGQEETTRYEWGDLADNIIGFMEGESEIDLDFDLPPNSLQNFVRGLSKFDKKQNKMVHKFSIPRDPRRIEAMVEFLTNPKSKGYACERDVLLAPVKPVVPIQLVEFLNEKKNSPQSMQMSSLQGQFISKPKDNEESQASMLHILETWNNRMAMVELTKYFINSVEKQSSIENLTSGTGHATHDLYSGWAVLSSEETLLICVQSIRDNNNLFYLSMGVDNVASQSQGPKTILFMEHDGPEENADILSSSDEEQFIENIIFAWRENLCVFRKEND